jgi:integrase
MSDRKRRAELLDQILTELDAREKAAEERPLIELWGEWRPTMAQSSRAPCIRACEYYLSVSVPFQGGAFVLAQLRPRELTEERLRAWLEHLGRTHKRLPKGTKETLAPGFQYQVRVNLNSCLAYHVKRGVMPKNPLSDIEWTAKPGVRLGYFASDQERDEFLSHFQPIVADMFLVAGRSGGLRRNEVRLLRKDQIDHETMEAHVIRKGGRVWVVILTPEDYAIIQRWSAAFPQSPFVFPNPRNGVRAFPRGTISSHLKKAQKLFGRTIFGGRKPRIHDLRHTWFKKLLDSDQPPPMNYLAEQSGLTSLKQIQEVYGKMRGPEARESFRRKLQGVTAPPLGVGKKR